jgi:UDP-N-acetylmuramyl pentapeptide phosphotransferase/UDP-N-acetylglucosamine-1-phosphate transferase
MMILASTGVAFTLALISLWALLRYFGAFALDVPNPRSLHARPVPRVGGVAVAAGVAAALLVGRVPPHLALLLALGLAIVSFLDDLKPLPGGVRLVAHLAAAGVFVWYTLSPMHPLELAALLLAVAWLTNLYNFMDGSDGLAAGMSIAGFSAYALAAWPAGDADITFVAAALAGASAAFLAFNFHPARVFLGDVGSIPLGFLAGALGLLGWRDDLWPLWFPLVVFGPFIGDATLTLLRRVWRREPLWQAHRDHYYQRLVRLGFGHRGTAYIAYALMLFCAAAALSGIGQRPLVQWSIVAVTVIVLGMVAIWVDVRWSRQA